MSVVILIGRKVRRLRGSVNFISESVQQCNMHDSCCSASRLRCVDPVLLKPLTDGIRHRDMFSATKKEHQEMCRGIPIHTCKKRV